MHSLLQKYSLDCYGFYILLVTMVEGMGIREYGFDIETTHKFSLRDG